MCRQTVERFSFWMFIDGRIDLMGLYSIHSVHMYMRVHVEFCCGCD